MMKRSTMAPAQGSWLTRERTLQDLLPAWTRREWLGALALVGAVVLAYLPVWHAGYVWDDRVYVEHNPYLDGLRGLKVIWTSSVADISPLAFTTFWVEHALWGVAPLPFHLVNVAQHGACAVLLWRVLLALRIRGAWLGAALWAMHPVNVESVAWVSELKNTQSGLFFLLAILYFIRWLRRADADAPAAASNAATWNYGLMLLFAALAMATKSSAVILPGVLCLAAWWIEGRWSWRNLARVAPVVAFSLAASALSIWTQGLVLATIIDPTFVRPVPERFVTVGLAVWFYLGKLLWPIPVMTGYPRWDIDTTKVTSWLPSLEVIVALIILWLKRGSWARGPFFAFTYFLGVSLPVLGLFDNYIFHYSLVFDHFLYLPSMAPCAWAGACLVRLAEGWAEWRSRLAAALLLVLGTLTYQRAGTFTSEETLWSHTIREYPDSWPAHQNLAIALAKRGSTDEAIRHYRKVIELYPGYPSAHNNVGLLLLDQGRFDDALAEFHMALMFDPKSGAAYNNIGNALLRQGKEDEALTAFEKAALVEPSMSEGPYNVGQVFLRKGQLDPAMEAFKKSLAADPNSADTYYALALVFMKKGDADKAIVGFRRCLELDPNNASAHENLGVVLVQKGQLNDGVIQYQKALEINPRSAPAETNLGVALFQAGLKDEAMKHLRKALELDPASVEATSNLGNAYLSTGQVDDAIAQYRKALVLDPTFSDAHRNLGVAFLYKGQPSDAIAEFQQVLKTTPADTVAQGLLAKAQAMATAKKPKPKPSAKVPN
jgi:Tfp pilus assembly protein PilF